MRTTLTNPMPTRSTNRPVHSEQQRLNPETRNGENQSQSNEE